MTFVVFLQCTLSPGCFVILYSLMVNRAFLPSSSNSNQIMLIVAAFTFAQNIFTLQAVKVYIFANVSSNQKLS